MNLPNKLTIARIILIPFFVLVLLTRCFGDMTDIIALIIFIISSLTDLIDGKIARKYNLVTNFGKFLDPLADKLLVCIAIICLLGIGRIHTVVVVIIVAREFIISGFRLVASDNGIVIAAARMGKYKTTIQMIMICMLLIQVNNELYNFVKGGVILIALVLTILSLIEYIYKNANVLKDVSL
ncbi:MAG: CDP-diacylglycerol--glycerol-3-phosphate 3-phosphatidyltransferase [Vallitaleaceae bacterium]|jgi:CDP-diacylglycerol--glycerol-3-phosphate 3-phosphatidyltransferase|nr:CDP-diacylglycerol--glycerol-3-phosphate 3-phosphatidyltransferase [Vallitaleaceae bacterium]